MTSYGPMMRSVRIEMPNENVLVQELVREPDPNSIMNKCFLGFRSLLKFWYSFTGKHDFIRLIGGYNPKDTSVSLFTFDVTAASVHKVRLWMPPVDNREGEFMISNLSGNGGLICLYNQYNFYISNPTTREILPLPYPQDRSSGSITSHCVIAFHPGRKKYILVAFPSESNDLGYILYQTFTLGTSKSWSSIGMAPYLVKLHEAVSVGGSLFWIHSVTDQVQSVISFDVSEGKFKDRTLLDTLFKNHNFSLVEMCGSLYLVRRTEKLLSIRLYDDQPSNGWPLSIIIMLNHEFKGIYLQPICIQNWKLILKSQSSVILVYHIKGRAFTRINMDIWPYVLQMPSLVSLGHLYYSHNVCSSLSCSLEHKVMEIPNILEEILSRTPAKSISRFRCVCKLWGTIIDHPMFISLRFEHYIKNSPLYLATYSEEKNSISLSHIGDSLNDQVWRLEEFVLGKFKLKMSSSTCNGLICLYNRTDVFVCNPMTREILALPSIEDMGDDNDNCLLTFVTTTREYKVVRLCRLNSRFFLFTLGVSKSWSSISFSHYPYPSAEIRFVPVSGFLFWFGLNNVAPRMVDSIISFDVLDETFSEIQLPELAIDDRMVYSRLCLVELQGRLSLVVRRDHDIEIWIKDQTADSYIWIKEAHFQYDENGKAKLWKPLCINKRKILFQVQQGLWLFMVAYDSESERFLFIRQIAKAHPHPLLVASLVSLSKNELKVDQSRYS